MRVAIFENHLNDLTQINLQLIKAFRLRVSAWPAGNVADIQSRIGVLLNNNVKGSNGRPPRTENTAPQRPRLCRFTQHENLQGSSQIKKGRRESAALG